MADARTLFLLGLSLLALANPAIAQDGASGIHTPDTSQTDTGADDGGLAEIVVTAEKRASVEQRTPIAMTVASGEELADNGVTDVNALANVAPTINIAQNNANTLITIRGVSSRDYTETGDPAVAVSIDNFYLQRAFALNAALFDVERVEVLRGPQGTLYGRNATAGAVNIQTRRPDFFWTGDASAEVGNYGLLNLDAAVSVPVSDTFALRVAGAKRTRQGFRDNSPVTDGDDNDTFGARVHALFEPNDRFSILVTGEMTDIDGVGPVIKGIPYGDVNADGTLDLGSTEEWELNNQGYTDIKTKAIRTAISYDLGFATASYFGGYQESDLNRDNDQDGGLLFNYGFQQNESVEDQNHELRLSSNADYGFKWQVGGYYFKEKDDLLTFFQVHGLGDEPFDFYTFDYLVESESKAVFAQVGLDLSEQLEIELGARYTHDEKSQVGFNDIAGDVSQLDNVYTGDKVTWHAGVNFQATPRNLIYAKVDRGYKAGGYTTASSFGPEVITAYEVGAKNRFFGNKLELNLTGFYYDYTDLQVQQEDPDTALINTLNAGEARIYGAELESVWLVTPDTRLDANVAWLDTKYTSFCTIDLDPCPAGADLSGNELTQAPEWTLAGGIQHDFWLGGVRVTPRVQTRYQSRSYFTILNRALEQQDSYWKTDATLTIASVDGPWSLTVFGRNLEDSTILTSSGEAGYAGGYLVQFAPPRTYGARLAFSF